MSYVTWGSIKHEETQKTIENTCQAIQRSEVTSKANNKSESHFTDNENLSYNIVDDCVKILSIEKSDVPDSNPIKTKKTFSKRKRKESTKQAKKILSKKREKKKLDETLLDSQSMRLCLVTHNDKKSIRQS